MGDRQRPDALDLQILELLARGYDDARVAYRVGLSHRSVQRRVQWLMTYLGAGGRVALGARAHATGLLRVAIGPELKSGLPDRLSSLELSLDPVVKAEPPERRRGRSSLPLPGEVAQGHDA
jgi:DNA-binding CsgD family transcriptional regulator